LPSLWDTLDLNPPPPHHITKKKKKERKNNWAGGVAQVLKHLLSNCKPLSSNSGTAKKGIKLIIAFIAFITYVLI
jgi:hypothetical protein